MRLATVPFMVVLKVFDYFDYIVYRVTRYYFKKRGNDTEQGVAVLTVMEGIIIVKVSFIIIWQFYPPSVTAQFKEVKTLAYAFAGLLYFLNYRRYKGKYEMLEERWGDETPRQRKVRGWLVVGAMIAPFIIFIL
ncbi:hypothetical protein [Rufibacter immobilis]|uniref:hypothetical protein n=1 Tax=Rufibacter immobilis TaxID=1348778 RepID=UPI0035F0EF19